MQADVRRPTTEDAVALLAGAGGVAGSYVATGLTPAFVASPIERWLARAIPGAVVTFAIQQLGPLGQKLNLLTAICLTAVGLAVLVRLAMVAGDRLRNHAVPVVAGGTLALAGTALVTGSFPAAAGATLGVVAVLALAGVAPRALDDVAAVTEPGRRRVLGAVGASIGLSVAAHWRTTTAESPDERTIPTDASPEARTKLALADTHSLDVDGIEPLVSREFYQVDINAADPDIDPAEWSLSITGAVETELTFSYEDLRSMPSRTAFATLRCVGDTPNGEQMDNALWTGVPIGDVIERAGPSSDCDCVQLHAVDGYYQVFPADALDGGLLAYGMNGRDLPRGHGYPLRALVPGRWGEVQVKWLEAIEFRDSDAEGYWEKRGWEGTGPVETVAKLHAVNDLPDGRTQVAGHAYAGLRGVSAVEVSTDGGDNWQTARLSESLPGADVWRQWAYEYDPPDGAHEVVVRAVEADGTVQTSEETDRVPSGATGWVSKTVE